MNHGQVRQSVLTEQEERKRMERNGAGESAAIGRSICNKFLGVVGRLSVGRRPCCFFCLNSVF